MDKYLNEFTNKDLKPINSFRLHKTLNKKVWNGFELKGKIRSKLLSIAQDFIYELDLNMKINDIILTGSLANYNYSEYSDYDLHILIDFSKINNDIALVKKYFDATRKNWNNTHDILINGYEVEIYCQDINEKHTASGIFSILNNVWIKVPTIRNFSIDTNLIKFKAERIMYDIDDAIKKFKKGNYKESGELTKKIRDRISKLRKDSLQNGDELSIGNLVFKMLRRNNYIKKVIDLQNNTYDKEYDSLIEKAIKESLK